MKISIIIPCYNVENYIDRCLESIFCQSMGMDELLVICVDDCSTDHTYEKLESWEKKYPDHMMLIRFPVHSGPGNIRNVAVSYVETKWVAFVDADDWLEPDYFEKLYEKGEAGGYEIVACRFCRDPHTEYFLLSDRMVKEVNKDIIIDSEEKRKELIVSSFLGYTAWGKIIQTSFLFEHQIDFFEDVTYEDNIWGTLLHLYVKKAYIFEEMLYHYFVNPNSIIMTSDSLHHYDCITVQTMGWRVYGERGFLEKYREELEIEHLYTAYLGGIKMLIMRFDKPNYSGYLLLRELMLSRIPDWKNNIYVKKGTLGEKFQMIMMSLEFKLSKEEFETFADNLKKIGI